MKKIFSVVVMASFLFTTAFASGDGKTETKTTVKTCEKGAACCQAHGATTASGTATPSCCQDKSKCNKTTTSTKETTSVKSTDNTAKK